MLSLTLLKSLCETGMVKYRFIIGLCLCLGAAVRLVHSAGQAVITDGVDAYFSERKGEIFTSVVLFCVGIGLILVDTFTRNPQAEQAERQRDELRAEILGMLGEEGESQQELNAYINRVYGKSGLFGLSVDELRRVKARVQHGIDEHDSKGEVPESGHSRGAI